jgi:hypothetical protein
MADERLQILRMVENGKLTAEEAARLIDALGESEPATPAQPRRLRLNVVSGGTRISISAPIAVAEAAAKLIPADGLTVGGVALSISDVLALAREEECRGQVLGIEAEDGSKVELAVD